MIINKIEIPQTKLAAFCNRWKIVELALFGSVLREEFGLESDVDLLATFEPDHGWSLFDHVAMEEELKEIFMRDVDLVNRQAIEQSYNPIPSKRNTGIRRGHSCRHQMIVLSSIFSVQPGWCNRFLRMLTRKNSKAMLCVSQPLSTS